MGLLNTGDPNPVFVQGAGSDAPFLFVCDHAGRATPRRLERLSLPESAFDLHIAWDIGAGALTQRLAGQMGACAIAQRYSRLVIDCNRYPDKPDAAPAVSDGVRVPGNEGLTEADRAERVAAIHTPYHAAIDAELDARAARELSTIIVFMHSFTPRMNGFERPWHFGVIHEETSRFSKVVLAKLQALDDFVTGDNLPYAMDGSDYSAPEHALARGIDYLELEVRQDLIADEAGQARIADVLRPVLQGALGG